MNSDELGEIDNKVSKLDHISLLRFIELYGQERGRKGTERPGGEHEKLFLSKFKKCELLCRNVD